jgi:hypothetical protein
MIAPLTERSGLIGGGVEDDITSDNHARDPYVRGKVSSGPHILDRRPGPHASPVKRKTAGRDAGTHREHIDLPPDAPRSAEVELLMRLAGEFPEIHTPRETAVMPPYSGRNLFSLPRARPDLADHRGWIDILGSRASESLRTGGMGKIPGEPSDSLPMDMNHRLAESLSISLDGPRAPADLLAFLSESIAADQGAGDWPGYGRRHPPGKGELVSSGEVHDVSAPSDRQKPFDPVTSRHMETLHKTGLAKTALEVLDSVATEAVISPPGPTMLPPMLPRHLAEQTPVPLASDLSLLEAMRESSQVGEDLGALAAKIKRILDEEARRYGIDV